MLRHGKTPVQLAGTRWRRAVVPLLWYVAAVAGVALVTICLNLVMSKVPPQRLASSYLLLVLALAVGGGRGPAILASVCAFLVDDWRFIPPEGNTLMVRDPTQWFALGLLLVVGISTGSLAAGLKQSAAEARRHSRETAMLYELSLTILAGSTLEYVLNAILERLTRALELKSARVLLDSGNGELRFAAAAPTPDDLAGVVDDDPEPQRIYATLRDGSPLVHSHRDPVTHVLAGAGRPRMRVTYLPLVLNGRLLGLLTAYGDDDGSAVSTDHVRLLDAFAAQTSLAIGRMRLIEEEERARTAAESAGLKSMFLAGISHDLRTPLTTIRTAAAVLHLDPGRDAKTRAKASIDSEVDRLDHFVDNLLEMSRIEGGDAPPQLIIEDVTELVGAAAERAADLLEGRRLQLSASADLPLTPVDGSQIGRVFTNLLENAIKFSPADAAISVDVSADRVNIVVRVHNIGASIPRHDQERIFDKFQRLRRDERAARGTGLGLAISKAIVEAHDGRIWTCNEDDGVAFYVALPIGAESAPAAKTPVLAVRR